MVLANWVVNASSVSFNSLAEWVVAAMGMTTLAGDAVVGAAIDVAAVLGPWLGSGLAGNVAVLDVVNSWF